MPVIGDFFVQFRNIPCLALHKICNAYYLIMKQNPFIISGYISPEYFCDREKEASRILDAINNRRHLTLFSPRRMGKSGLIKHAFHLLRSHKAICTIYVDVLATTTMLEFVEAFGKAVFTSIGKKESIIKKLLKRLSALRLKVTIDPLSGEPALSLDVTNNREAEQSLSVIFGYLAEHKHHFVIAIDEFQQIMSYPEKNMEAILRTHIQHINNVTLIFSGSSRHILTEIFSMPNRPFYNTTEIMEITNIDPEIYKNFINDKFEKGSRSISVPALEMIHKITGMHTFYVQYLCNRLYSGFDKVDEGNFNRMLLEILNESEPVYANYLRLLTTMQFRVLKAIALNDGIANPTSKEFLSSYNLGAASTVSQSVKSLTEKDFIFLSGEKLRLNDVFFSQWIKYKAE